MTGDNCTEFILPLFVPHLSFFGSLGGLCFMIVAFLGYLHFRFGIFCGFSAIFFKGNYFYDFCYSTHRRR